MTGGLLLVLAGAWVVTQVLAGNALERLGIITGEEAPRDYNRDPGTGTPNTQPGEPYLTDPEGRPY